MSLSDDILTILFDYSAGYKRMRQLLTSPTLPHKSYKKEVADQDLYMTLARLKNKGFVIKENKIWGITQKGKRYFQKKLIFKLPSHYLGRNLRSVRVQRSIIIAFDIPEKYRRKRDWLRTELVILGFIPIQKSVWLGPAPLPENFITNLKNLAILKCLKFFEAKEKEII